MKTNIAHLFLKRPIIITATLVCIVALLTHCVGNNATPAPQRPADNFAQYAGSQVCAHCHADIYKNHLHTEHHLSTALVNDSNILGSFEEGKNQFLFDATINITMQKTSDGFYQVAFKNGKEVKREKFDIVVGSGRKGQSYLTWNSDNSLAQLPITYFTSASQWSNSPGYPAHMMAFNRPITSRCLECHSTLFTKTSDSTTRHEQFDRTKIIVGIECEKCHGPATAHVQFHQANKSTEAKFIVNPAKLSRERLLDFCSLCHGGALSKTKPSFSFAVGDTLSNYFSLQNAMLNADNIDVHGNQAGLLALSKCFSVGQVTCLNCHDAHKAEKDLQIFSSRCTTCHNEGHGKVCKMTASLGERIKQNCIDCHMPKQSSHAIAVYLQGADAPTPALLRTHYIKIYPEETKKFLAGRTSSKILKH